MIIIAAFLLGIWIDSRQPVVTIPAVPQLAEPEEVQQ